MAKNGYIQNFRKVSHIIFDMDGLLLDTETLYTLATQKILEPFGHTYTFAVKLELMGLQHQQMSEKIIEIYNLPIAWQDYSKQQREILLELMGNAELMPGAEKLLRHLKANDIPFALATSSGEDMVHLKTTNHRELFNLFNHRVCGSTDPDVKNGKPAPDIFLVAAGRFSDNPSPDNCLVFEDSPNGVTAAAKAGMQCVMVPDSRVPEELRAEATQVLSSLKDFKPEDFGLPPFDQLH